MKISKIKENSIRYRINYKGKKYLYAVKKNCCKKAKKLTEKCKEFEI